MKKFLTTAALVMSIGITSVTASTAPARAEPDGAEVLTALGLLALFAYAAKEQRDDRKKATVHKKPAPKKRFSKVLPAKCMRVANTRNDQYRVFGKRCLQNNYRHVNRLPRFCETNVRVKGQWRAAYNARCLRNQGFTRA